MYFPLLYISLWNKHHMLHSTRKYDTCWKMKTNLHMERNLVNLLSVLWQSLNHFLQISSRQFASIPRYNQISTPSECAKSGWWNQGKKLLNLGIFLPFRPESSLISNDLNKSKPMYIVMWSILIKSYVQSVQMELQIS